jgi:hypothetical protein
MIDLKKRDESRGNARGRKMTHATLPGVLALALLFASPVMADPTLALETTFGDGPIAAGDLFEVTLTMSDLGANQAAGFVAFVEFDETEVAFVGGTYTASPFGSHIIDPIVANGPIVSLAAGIDPGMGQTPTSSDALLATLTFISVSGSCVSGLGFADSPPATAITDDLGQAITPLVLLDLTPIPTNRLSLSVDFGMTPVEPDDFITVTLSMTICSGAEAAGWQAFLEFDSSQITFVSGAYTQEPFSLPIITPIVADGELISLAAGIDVANGQPPATGLADLAVLTFQSVGGGCIATVDFADHVPPTRITDPLAEPFDPLMLDDLPQYDCIADIVPNCEVDVLDLLELLASWGQSGVPADIDGNGVVDVVDLLILLSEWGPCWP